MINHLFGKPSRKLPYQSELSPSQRREDLDRGYAQTQSMARITGEVQRETLDSMTSAERLAYLRKQSQ